MFMLRIRLDDQSEWGPAIAYPSKRERDKAAAFNRVIGGLRTHSWTESKREHEQRLRELSVSPLD